MMERLNHSDGPAKVQKAYGKTRFGAGETNDLLYVLRTTYPQYFRAPINNQQQISQNQQYMNPIGNQRRYMGAHNDRRIGGNVNISGSAMLNEITFGS